MPMVSLQSKDEVSFEVDSAIAERSETVKSLADTIGLEEDGTVIPLPEVHSETLKLVIEWMNHFKDAPIEPDQDINKDPWVINFFKVDQGK